MSVVDELESLITRLPVGLPSPAGARTAAAAVALAEHLAAFAEPGPDGLVFPAPEGGYLRRSNFRRRGWLTATRAAGVNGLRFHDLRHLAAKLPAQEEAEPPSGTLVARTRRAKAEAPGGRAARAADLGCWWWWR
jgi:integrase